MALFKQPDNIVRRIEVTTPFKDNYRLKGETNVPNISDQIPVVYGRNFYQPPIVYQDANRQTRTIILGLSANYTHTLTDLADTTKGYGLVGRVFWGGKAITGIKTFFPFTDVTGAEVLTQPRDGYTGSWRTGRNNLSPNFSPMGVATHTNWGGQKGGEYYPQLNTMFFQYLRAGDKWTSSTMYRAFTEKQFSFVPSDRPFIPFLPDTLNMDVLIIHVRENDDYDLNAEINLDFTRYPIIPDGSGGFERASNIKGHAIFELLTNPTWGFGFSSSQYERTDFIGVGNPLSGRFNLGAPLIDIVDVIDQETTEGPRLFEQQGKIRYVDSNSTGLSITDDNIIGSIEIQYPDVKTIPTKLVATYESFEKGTTTITLGNDNTNVINTEIMTATDYTEALAIAENLYKKLRYTVTLDFVADRSMHQFTVNDTLSMNTSVFSGTITIIEMVLQDDYTFKITAEASIGSVTPDFVEVSGRPIIDVGGNLYRPKINERDFDPAEEDDNIVEPPPTPPIITPPEDIEPPAKTLRSISGLVHPYNFVTGGFNTDWYLGSTINGTTSDGVYDSNGCRTRFVDKGTYAHYETDLSCIFRPDGLADIVPTGIMIATDIGLNSQEETNGLLGEMIAAKNTRYHWPGVFSNQPGLMRYHRTGSTDWTQINTSWASSINEAKVIHGGGLDPKFVNSNPQGFVYQHGDGDITGNPTRLFSTLDPNNANYGVNRPALWRVKYGDPRTTKTDGSNEIYRLHIIAIYGSAKAPTRAEYVGSTSTFADGRSIQTADQAEARDTARQYGQTWSYTYTTPPSRSVS